MRTYYQVPLKAAFCAVRSLRQKTEFLAHSGGLCRRAGLAPGGQYSANGCLTEHYPFALHGLSLTPSILMLCSVQIFIGSEDAVFAWFSALRKANPDLTRLVALFSNWSVPFFYLAYAFFLVRGLRGKKREDIFFVIGSLASQVLVAAILGRLLKIAVGRPRPMTGGPLQPFSFGWGYQSFPSGHTTEAVGVVLPFVWRFGRLKPLLLPLGLGCFIAAVGFSRIFLSMHHPTDIWGGLVLGSLSGYLSWVFCHALLRRWKQRNQPPPD